MKTNKKRARQKYNPKICSLISNHTYDYYHPDFVNYVLKEEQDGPFITVSQLTEEQAKIALCIMIKHFDSLHKQLDKLSDILTLSL